jgi:thiol-disulfide isomerase/thioredoxin
VAKQMLTDSKPQVVAAFKAKWCGPCKLVAPLFSSLAKQHPRVVFVKIDVDETQVIDFPAPPY